jgi:hypothetical protein
VTGSAAGLLAQVGSGRYGDASMMRDDLERALADDFDADHLSVYGDYLQSVGDPRGELIALDLCGRDGGRRDQLIAEWLGPDVAELLAMTVIEHGFITDLYLDGNDPRLLDAILAGPAAPYIRGATVLGDAEWVRTALVRLSERVHPWLHRLSVQISGVASPTLAGSVAAALARATPRLEQLEVWGRGVLTGFSHPAVRSLRLTGYDAIDALLENARAKLPAVAVLDLAFHVERGESFHTVQSVCTLVGLPKLRRLDLSRNEPGLRAPHYLGGHGDAFAFLAELPVRRQLTHVRLPSLRSQAQADHLAEAIAGMPALREIAIVRGYRGFSHLVVPAVVRQPAPWPWQPADELEHTVIMATIQSRSLPGGRVQVLALSPVPIVAWLEEHFAGLQAETRAAWTELFELLQAHRGVALSVPRREIRPMLDALEDDSLGTWLQLREAVRAYDCESLSVTFES